MVLRRADRCDPSTGPGIGVAVARCCAIVREGLAGPPHMRRRDFISIFGSAVAWPLAVRAQQAGKPPTIGFLGANNATFERASTDAFVQRLRELGWIEKRTVAIEYRWAEGRDERFAEIVAEF